MDDKLFDELRVMIPRHVPQYDTVIEDLRTEIDDLKTSVGALKWICITLIAVVFFILRRLYG